MCKNRRSKQEQKRINALNRVTVNMNLSTKVFKSKKDYDRNKSKSELRKAVLYGDQLDCWYLDSGGVWCSRI